MKNFFITGTDTGVGKTLITCALMVALRERGIHVAPMKPVAAGVEASPVGTNDDDQILNDDVAQMLSVYGKPIDAHIVNPYCFGEAIAPHLAAQHEGRTIDLKNIDAAFQSLARNHDTVLVEGAGGFLVPLSATESMSVLPARLGLDVILVVGMRLGCLNHALLTVEAIHVRGIKLAGWVANTIDPHMNCFTENIATLKQMIAAPCLGIVPYLPANKIRNNVDEAASYLQIGPLLG